MKCERCGKTFLLKESLRQHMKTHSGEKLHVCDICQKYSGRKNNFRRHILSHSREKQVQTYEEYKQEFSTKNDLLKHVREQHTSQKHKRVEPSTFRKLVRKENSTLGVFSTYVFIPDDDKCHELNMRLNEMRYELIEKLKQEISDKTSVKWYLVLHTTLSRTNSDGEEEILPAYFRCKCFIELNNETIDEHITEGYLKINQSFEEFIQRSSNWRLDKIQEMELFSARYYSLAASSYLFLPDEIVKKKAVLSIKVVIKNASLGYFSTQDEFGLHSKS